VKSCFAFALAGVLVIAISCSHTQRGAPIDPAFRSAISPDAQDLFAVDLDKLKATDFYHRHQQDLDLPQINAMAERAGLDPRRDLSKILIVWDGKNLQLLAIGALSTSQLEQKLTAAGAQRTSYKSFTLFTRLSDSVAFPDNGLAFAASTPVLESTLDRWAQRSGSVPSELQDRLAEVPADSQLWVVSRGGLPTAGFALRSDIDSAISNIAMVVSGTSIGVRFDSGLHFQARIVCKSPEGAQRVNDALRGLIGFARLSTQDNQLDLLRMWDAISISKDQQAVLVKADLASDLTDKLLAQVAALRGRIPRQ